MGFIYWIITGILAGFIASKIVYKAGSGLIVDLILGIVGAVVGGYLFEVLGFARAGGPFYTIFVAVIGAIGVIFIYHAITGRRTTI